MGIDMGIVEAVHKAESWMDTYDGVTSVAQGEKDGQAVISVFVTRKEVAKELPDQFEGFTVVPEISDEFFSY